MGLRDKLTHSHRHLNAFIAITFLVTILMICQQLQPRMINKLKFLSSIRRVLHFSVGNSSNASLVVSTVPVKKIFRAGMLFGRKWDAFFPGWDAYRPVACEGGFHCTWSRQAAGSDAILFHARELASAPLKPLLAQRHAAQRWVFLSWESVINADVHLKPNWASQFNWTATYMHGSDIRASYYRGFVPRAPNKRPKPNEALYDPKAKRRMAYAVISNCNPRKRLDLIHALQQHIKVDLFGHCGKPIAEPAPFFNLSRQYRFYLAFENSCCRDYITEKFWYNGLMANAVPVAYGGLERTDYERVAPPKSFVHTADFPDVARLAQFLKRLAANETEYASYFKWKHKFQVDTYSMKDILMCGLCRRLHEDHRPSIRDIGAFWNRTKQCKETKIVNGTL